MFGYWGYPIPYNWGSYVEVYTNGDSTVYGVSRVYAVDALDHRAASGSPDFPNLANAQFEQVGADANATGNVAVRNDTASWYRYFGATAHAEYLYQCVETTMLKDLPDEVNYLRAFDWFGERVLGIVDMPRHTLDLLHRFLRQNNGKLSTRARTKEFAKLTA